MRVSIKDVMLIMAISGVSFFAIVVFFEQLQPDEPVVPGEFSQRQIPEQYIKWVCLKGVRYWRYNGSLAPMYGITGDVILCDENVGDVK